MNRTRIGLVLGVFVAATSFLPAPARAREEKKRKPKVPTAARVVAPATQPVRPTPSTPLGRPTPPIRPTMPGQPGDSVQVLPLTPAPEAMPPRPAPPSVPVSAPDVEDLTPEEAELYRCKKLPARARIKLTFKPETELKELIQWAMGFTCKNFIMSTGVSGRGGKVTIIAPGEMTPDAAWRLFLIALQTMNLTVVPKGNVLEVVESPRARELPVPVYSGSDAVPATDQILRVIIRPDNLTVEELSSILGSLKSKDGVVTPLPNAGVVLVTDYGTMIREMAGLLKEVDMSAEGEKIYIVRVQNADATEVAQKLNEIFSSSQRGSGPSRPAPAPVRDTKRPAAAPAHAGTTASPEAGTMAVGALPSKIIADERTNSLIVIASERAYARLLALVKRLDVAVEGGEGRIHVYYLDNADAEELAGTLNGLISGQAQRQGRPGAQPGAAPPAGGGGGAGAQGAGGPAFEGQVRVTADKPTNSLVITSSVKDFISMREVIRRLDVPRRQVFVEATILEVSLSRGSKIGLGFHGGTKETIDGEDILFLAGSQQGVSSLDLKSLAGLGGAIGGIFGPQLDVGMGVTMPSLGLAFQLLATNSDVNVLSSPHLLTTDNNPSEINIGQDIPFQGAITGIPGFGQAAGQQGGASGGFPFQSINRQQVGLKLKLTPHVNESDLVRLELELEVSDVGDKDPQLGPSWSKRTLKTMVTVPDQQPVALGGLVSDRTLLSESKVPLLGDIPILGYLFKYETADKRKINLLIILTPYIIKEHSDIRRIFERKARERREFMQTFTSFSERELQPEIDYRRKRGLIEEVNQRARQAEEDARLEAEAAEAARRYSDEGPVEELPPMPAPAPAPMPAPAPAPAPEPRID